MNTANEYVPQGPRDQESQNRPSEQQGVEQDRPKPNPDDPRVPTVTPETDKGQEKAEPKDRDHQRMQGTSPDEDDDRMDEEDEGDEEEWDEDDRDTDEDEPERDHDTGRTDTGEDFSTPANNPRETNFEDPAQNRKTDPMTDHDSRVGGI